MLVPSLVQQMLDQWFTLDGFLQLFFDNGELRSITVIAEDSNKFTSCFNALDLAHLPDVSA